MDGEGGMGNSKYFTEELKPRASPSTSVPLGSTPASLSAVVQCYDTACTRPRSRCSAKV